MIKADLVECVVESTGLSKNLARIAVETILDTMRAAIVRGERIELRGFGVFEIRPRKTGIGRNPKTGEEVRIPPGKAVRFKPGKHLQAI
ncbi:MAG: integration host factor subunit beta [Bryobacterales bacterium]|nr:integration host factor subunit beta [Bryobacterales bacterium]